MGDEGDSPYRPDWGDPASYDYTRNLTRAGWAWEFLRRNPVYAKTAAMFQADPSQAQHPFKTIGVIDARDAAGAASAWGCTFYEAADRPAYAATVFWRGDANPTVLPVEARLASPDHNDAFDIAQCGCRAAILHLGDGLEHVLIGDGIRQIQLAVRGRSLLLGPVLLHYDISGFDDVESKLLTVQRLVALRRLHRFPHSLFPPERRARRWTIALRALDGSRTGAPPHDIATVLFGQDIVRRDWNGASDYLRSRVRRAIAAGEYLAGGRHLDLLRTLRRRPGASLAETPS